MYKMRLVSTKEQILDFAKRRYEACHSKKEVKSEKDCSFFEAIESGDMIALNCLDEETIVGGILLEQQRKNLKITRLFVDKGYQEKGAGTFMLQYVSDHQSFFEDYYGTELKGIVTEPTVASTDFYFKQGYDYSGNQMYKSFIK